LAPSYLRFNRTNLNQGAVRMARRMTITFESETLLMVRARSLPRGWCPRCAAESEMIAPALEAISPNQDQNAIDKWLNSENLHRTEAADGSLQICLNSLLAHSQKTTTPSRGFPAFVTPKETT
jgi:hypothetical protein